jgi:hypothetical protein
MSEQEINALIAEACGRERNPDGGWYPDNGLRVGTQAIPDYCNDLNAMHEAEKTLTEEQWNQMFGCLISIRWENASENERRGIGLQKYLSPARATAHERAEAFLRMLGKWEEGE